MTSSWWHDAVDDWTLITEWWKHPALAYVAGLVHGVQLERDRQAPVDDAIHRTAVRQAIAFIERCEAREVSLRRIPAPVHRAGSW